jgi:rSAM/selenodomain-associated transferase 1
VNAAQGQLLQQFARLPVPGQVKTRLLGEFTAVDACAIHEELLLRTAATLCGAGQGTVELWLDRAGQHRTIDAALALGASGPFYQCDGDLGARMQHALAQGLTRAAGVVLVGSDCPDLCAGYLRGAFAALQQCDVVLGPADDGGFVLIGCRRVAAHMLDDVPWGSEQVLEATRASLASAGLSTQLLESRQDIDTPDDVRRWKAESGALSPPA